MATQAEWKAFLRLSNREVGSRRIFGMGAPSQGLLLQLIWQIGPGFSVKRREDRDLPEGCEIVAEKAYSAAWVHFLKAQGMPVTISKSTWLQIVFSEIVWP